MSRSKRRRRSRGKSAAQRLPRLPALLHRKLYKTGQTRGADDDEIYQNRVLRQSTVLIPYNCWDLCALPPDGSENYENGFITLISPSDYFETENIEEVLAAKGLSIGRNALVFYETREQWNLHNPAELNWTVARRRRPPLAGRYVARVPATTAADGRKILRGFETRKPKGAGIRVYEYASTETIAKCRDQLEALFWFCKDADDVIIANGMADDAAKARKTAVLKNCEASGLLNKDQLQRARAINRAGNTICPLCLEEGMDACGC